MIPSNWTKIKFEELAEQKSVRVDNPRESGFDRYVGLEHLDSGVLTVKRWGRTQDVNSGMKLFNKGDILFARRNTYLKRVSLAKFDGVCSGDIIVIKPILNHIIEGFLPIYMQFEPFENKVISLSAGAFSKRIKWKQLIEEEIWIPPKEEQKNIVNLIWSIQNNIETTETIIKQLFDSKNKFAFDMLKMTKRNGVLIEPTGKNLPPNWNIYPLNALVESFQNGFASGKRDLNGIVQIRMNNLNTNGELSFEDFLKVPEPKNLDRYSLKEKDLLFNNTNSVALVGKAAIFHSPGFNCTFSNHFTRIRVKEGMVLPEILLFHLVTYQNKKYFEYIAKRHVGQSAVSTKDLQQIKMIIPPIQIQKKLVDSLKIFTDNIACFQKYLLEIKLLKRKLTDVILSGKISVGESNV